MPMHAGIVAQQLPAITDNYWQLPAITNDYQQLPTNTWLCLLH
jgi:hypothetical protein